MIAVLANVITTAWSAVCVHLMRRDAPIRQRRATSWVDQSPILASFAGLILLAIAHGTRAGVPTSSPWPDRCWRSPALRSSPVR